MFNRFATGLVIAMITSPAIAQQQPRQQQPSPLSEAVDAAYALGLQTGQSVTTMLKEQDDRLKWVLDNWVAKQPEPAKP